MSSSGGFYDFTSDLASNDTAYTSLALDAHTDTTYFSDPAGLQMFHLLSHTGGDGGHSLLVDGHEVAARLQFEDPDSFLSLSTVPIAWHASGNNGVSLSPNTGDAPVISSSHIDEMGSDFRPPLVRTVDQIRWNNADRATSEYNMGRRPMQWYQAASRWAELIRHGSVENIFQLEPGRPLRKHFFVRYRTQLMSSLRQLENASWSDGVHGS